MTNPNDDAVTAADGFSEKPSSMPIGQAIVEPLESANPTGVDLNPVVGAAIDSRTANLGPEIPRSSTPPSPTPALDFDINGAPARTLLGLFDLTGMLVTGDAIHCQAETARLVRDRGGECCSH